MKSDSKYQAIYQAVRQIPFGKVATYGQIATIAGLPGQARLAGYALYATPDSLSIPWHRVMNAKGEISRLPDPDSSLRQRELLEQEGIKFNGNGKIDLNKYQWEKS